MKSLMVVSQLNDPFYIDYDVEFAKYIIDRAKRDGLIMEEDADVTELDANLVMQLFSPLVLSQSLLIDQTREPCSSILCPNGFIFAFKQTNDLLFIAVNGDGTESELFLHRKLQVFIMIMRFMFGPACEEMGQSHLYSKKGKWDFLHQLMQSWSDLVQSEQAFLVEAIERVHVNQMMNEKCMDILLKSIKLFQAASDQPTHHAMLLVNSKLLALYSNRSAHEIRPKDLLMAMIVSKTLYPQKDKLEDLFSKFYVSTKLQREHSFITDDNSDVGDDEYHSAPTTPGSHRSQSPSSIHKSDTVKNTDSSDEDSQTDILMENISLLAMFKEKCPDVVFPKESGEQKRSAKDKQVIDVDQVGRDSIKSVLNVEAVIHQNPDTDEGLLEPSWVFVSPEISDQAGQENACSLDLKNSNLQNLNNIKFTSDIEAVVTTYSPSGKVKHENSGSQSTETNLRTPATSDTAEKGSKDQVVTFANEIKTPVESIDNEMFKSKDSSVVRRNSETTASDHLLLFGKHESISSLTGESINPTENSSFQPSSSAEHHVSLLPENENLINEDAPAKNKSIFTMDPSDSRRSSIVNQGIKSRASTFSQLSRSSSVISNMSKSYPALLPENGEDFQFTGAKMAQSEDLYNVTAGSKRINAAMGSPKTSRLLHTSVPIATSSTTESSSVTPEMATSLSAFSSTSSSSGVYLPQTIFLETSTCPYSPYNFYTVQISPGLTLILLSQAQKHSLADSLYQVIQTIQDVIYGRRSKLPRSRSTYVYDTINAQLGRVHNSLKKVKGKVKNLSFDVLMRWEKDEFKHKLLDFLEKDSSFRIQPELESPLMEIYKRLRELFSHLFLSPVACSSQQWDSLAQIRDLTRAELRDYREYLNVKARRNITMTSYVDEFPGLIHFIFIDRHFHQMTAPSLNISLKDGEKIDATSYLKEKIWTMHQHMMSKLTEGYTTVIMRDGDFYFSYFLWFDDYMGNPLPVQESYKPSRNKPYPGILCGQFYKDLLQSCFPHAIQGSIHCNEVFLMHLGTVHPMYIAAHCRKLAYKMWEMSGEILHSVNLL